MTAEFDAVGVFLSRSAVSVVRPRTLEVVREATLGLLGYGLLAGVAAAALAFVVRSWTVRELPPGPATLVGLAIPAIPLTVAVAGRGSLVGGVAPAHHWSAGYLLAVFAAGTVAIEGGRRVGDSLARGVLEIPSIGRRGPLAALVRSGGLAVVVALPETVEDADGYPRVADRRKRSMAGETLLFPARLSTAELESRLRRRLEEDYDVGYVAVSLADDGSVDSLAVGGRPAGIGPTLAPDRVAISVETTPSPRVGAGDPVEVWSAERGSLVARGRVRARTGATATLIVDEDDAAAFAVEERYRLATRPEPRTAAHDLVAVLLAADETVTTLTVEPNGPLEGEFVDWLPGTVLVIDRDDGVRPIPAVSEPLRAGDTVYLFADPDALETVADDR